MKQKKFTFRDFQTILALVLLGLLLAAGLVTLNWWLAGQFGAGADFLSAWNGARAFLFENIEPYSRTVAEWTQGEVYGRAARAGEYPYALDIPFPLLILLFPFAFIHDPVWARAVWMTASEIGLLALVTFALRLADWQPKRWFTFLLLAFSLTWFYSATSLLDGSLSILLTLALIGALFAMRDFNDELAGFLLAIAALKWEATLLLWSLIIIGAFSAKRWRVFSGLGMTWFVLGVAGFLWYPDWIWPYLRAVTANWRADDILTPVIFMQKWIPDYGARLTQIVVAIFLLVLVVEWFAALRGKEFRRVAWVAALAIAFTPLLGFSTSSSNLAPLVFSFTFILPYAWERWEKRPYLVVSLFVFLFFAFPLVLYLPAVSSRVSVDGLTFLLPPVLTVLGLYWIRWYVVRPPRTWLDGVRREVQK